MTLADLGNLGDFLGGVGVVITLVYLALQIRQNTEQIRQNSSIVRASGTASLAQANTQTSLLLARDAETNALFWTGLDHPEELAEAEFRRFEAILSVFLQAFTQNHDLYREGALTDEIWKTQQAAYLWMADRPGFHLFWESWKSSYPGSAAEIFDEAVERSAEQASRTVSDKATA